MRSEGADLQAKIRPWALSRKVHVSYLHGSICIIPPRVFMNVSSISPGPSCIWIQVGLSSLGFSRILGIHGRFGEHCSAWVQVLMISKSWSCVKKSNLPRVILMLELVPTPGTLLEQSLEIALPTPRNSTSDDEIKCHLRSLARMIYHQAPVAWFPHPD